MKAGIYKTPNGNLIYVAKDRTIKATTLKPSTWPGMKVSQRGSAVVFLDYQCDHVSNVPNGCTDHQGWLDAWAPGYFAKALCFSPSAAQLLAQSDNAARAQGEMVHKLVAEGYVEVPGTDELVHPGVEVSITFSDEHSRLARSMCTPPDLSGKDAWDETGPATRDAYKRYAALVYGSPKCEHMAVKNTEERPTLIFESTPGSGVEGFLKYAEQCNVVIDKNEAVDMAEIWREDFRSSLRKQGWGICHSRSARKHRKRGDNVIPLSGGLFAWKAGKLYPYQASAARLFTKRYGYMDCPAGIGKS